MNKKLEIVVFFAGAIGMVLELVGSRVLAPFFGNSLFVWTGLIGVILGSMSLGYYLGGRMADKHANANSLAKLLLIASVFVLISAFFKEELLPFISNLFSRDIRTASLVATVLLFAPSSIALGCVAPFAARIRLVSKKKIGSIVGSLYALSTLGSITGTFLAGYFLIPTFGNSILLYILSLSLLILSCISVANIHRFHILTFIVFGVLFYMNVGLHLFRLNVLEDVDSLYNRIIVRNLNKGNVSLITLSTDNIGMQSSIDLLFPEKLNSDHNNAYRIGGLINRNIDKTLMLGGAGFTFPRYFLENNLGKSIDVVEIDPKMQELAKKYYFLKDDPRMRIFSTDARLFIKNCTDKYDVIYVDAFTSFNPPYHLTTVEFMTDLRSHLTENGILMVNMISAITGDKSEFLNVEGNTIKHVFGQVDLFVIKQSPSELIQNLILVAYNNERPKVIETSDKLLERLISKRYNLEDKISSNVLLTDDFAPVDYITRNFINVANK